MTTRDLDVLQRQLRAFLADRRHDPAVDPLKARATALEGQLQGAVGKHEAAQRADVDAHLAAETALVAGDTFDSATLGRLRAAVLESAHTVELLTGALEQVRRDIGKATAARADRDLATLTPIFRQLMTLGKSRAEALGEVMELLSVAHEAATAVLPGSSNALLQGYAGLLTREHLERWCERGEAAGLLPAADCQRVA